MRKTLVIILVVLAAGCSSRDDADARSAEQNSALRAIESELFESDRTTGEVCQQMSEVDPIHPILLQFAFKRHYFSGGFEEFAESLSRCVEDPSPLFDLVQGVGALDRNDLTRAEELFERARQGYNEAGHPAGVGTAHYNLATVCSWTDRPDEAQEHLGHAAEYQHRVGDVANEADARLRRADILFSLGRPRAALDERQAVVALTEDRDVGLWCETRIEVADGNNLLGDYETAHAGFLDLVQACGSTLLPERVLYAEMMAIDTAIKLGALSQAKSMIEEWLERATLEKSHVGQSAALQLRGEYGLATGAPLQAYEDFRQAEEALDPVDPRRPALKARGGLAMLRAGQLAEARRVIESALSSNVQPEEIWVAHAHNDLAVIARNVGEIAEAVLHQSKALSAYEAAGDLRGVANSQLNLSVSYYALGAFDKSLASSERAVEMSAELRDPTFVGKAHVARAASMSGLGQWRLAVKDYRTALESLVDPSEDRVRVLASLAAALARVDALEDAQDVARKATELAADIGEPEHLAFARNVAGRVASARGDLNAALGHHRKALEVASRARLVEHMAAARWWMGDLHRESNSAVQAGREYATALDLLELQRGHMGGPELRRAFHAENLELYENAIQVELAGTAADSRVFELIEMSRSRSLKELLEESRLSLRARLTEQQQADERALVAALTEAHRAVRTVDEGQRSSAVAALEKAQASLATFRLDLRVSNPDYAAVEYPVAADLAEVQRLLGPDELLLEFFVGESQAWRMDITRQEVSLHELPIPSRIEQEVLSIAKVLQAPALGGVPGHGAGRLAASILPDSIPEGITRLLVVPDGALHRLPFEVIRGADGFLVEKYEIVALPSATTLVDRRVKPVRRATSGWIGLGAPASEGADSEFPPLRYAGPSLESIAGLFTTSREVVMEQQLVRESFEAQPMASFRYIHFATHASIDSENPSASGLLFSDGLVRLDEVLQLDLNAELVTLSACESATGELVRGEGFIGLTRAFLYAGSDAVLASLWNVNDKSTADFMVRFYSHIRDGMSVPAALRRTKIEFIRSDLPAHRDPYRWAPFVLIGHPSVGETEPVARRND
ncbi:hypothetical protein ABI59_22690 [Acidobacteria bacterium Mor1]|nr:hypothetical protein ABI59_22690 [Acidobacteria bacterium Mor1]